ncbi:MAG: LPS export ABC transporter ATP-binding protein [Candidatus Ratteibacteria bacterium]|jgi:lipopolysaccharide export system ATP-binding protein
MLEAVHIAKTFGGRRVVEDLSLSLEPGEVVGLLGPNGAGKTTSFNILMGFVSPDQGMVRVNGKDLTRLPVYMRARMGVSYLFQEPALFLRLSVLENLLIILESFFPSPTEQERTALALLETMGLLELQNTMAAHLSGGEKRRLEIARGLINNPKYFLLDEPFSGIDPKTVSEIKKMVRQLRDRGAGVLITDHNVRDALSIMDRAYLIYRGTIIAQGSPEELLKNREGRQVYFGEDFTL